MGRSRGGGAGRGRGGRRLKAKGERGAGPQILRWRLFNVEIPISLDGGKDDWGVSDAVIVSAILLSVLSTVCTHLVYFLPFAFC